jgi:hypothetical protein
MAEVTYNTENLIAGAIQTQQVKFAADTYYRGMPLEYDAGNDRWKYYTADAKFAAVFLGEEVTLTDNEYDAIIIGGAVSEVGLVDNSNAALTVTEDMIAAAAANGIYIKRK